MNRTPSVFQLALPTVLPSEVPSALGDTSIEALLREADRLGVFAAVFSCLRQAGLGPLRDSWKRRVQANLAQNLLLRSEQEQILDQLHNAGIPCLPIRGVSLTERLYPDLSWRSIADIDVLVCPEDVRTAYDTLKSHRFADAENPWNAKALARLARRPALHSPELRFISAQGVSVELHWDWLEASLPEDDLFSAPEAYLVYLCRHAGKHFWYDLRWLTDIELLLREFGEELDWDRVWTLARANRAIRPCAATFELCVGLFGRDPRTEERRIGRGAGKQLAREAEQWLIAGKKDPFWDRPVVQLLRVDGVGSRIRRVVSWLAPAPRHWTRPDGSTPSATEVWVDRYLRFAFHAMAALCPFHNLRRRLRKASQLTSEEWLLLLRAWLLLPVMALAVRAVRFPRVHTWAGKVRRVEPPACASKRANRIAELVRIAAGQHFRRLTCLPQSLALLRLLGREGIQAHLKLGVRRQAGRVEGHAWIEFEGTAVNEPRDPDEEFQLLRRPGSEPSTLIGTEWQ